tara:strand:- start:7 stop:177 length:171 start_codon:yes stop_codon:yes gene_type:complete
MENSMSHPLSTARYVRLADRLNATLNLLNEYLELRIAQLIEAEKEKKMLLAQKGKE